MRNDGKQQPYKQARSTRMAVSWVLLAFITGYLVAAFFDLDHLLDWCKKTLLNAKNESSSVQVAQKSSNLPKPKFEFYTLLTKDQRDISTQPKVLAEPKASAQEMVTVKPNAPSPKAEKSLPLSPASTVPVVEHKSPAYWVQVASFKNQAEASRAKASLLLKGFDVSIFSAPETGWFRVVLGPFSSKKEAQKTQIAFAQSEHVQGMIRQFNA